MKKYIYIILVALTLLSSCEQSNVKISRLAENYNTDWGTIATNITAAQEIKEVKNIVCVAVIDTGANVVDNRILQGYNVIDNSRDCCDKLNHGTILCEKLLEINKNIYVIPIKIFDEDATLEVDKLCKGIKKAAELEVDVINIACGIDAYYKELEDVINYAISKSIIIVSAAGNDGMEELLYPARFDNVISVMARDINNKDLSYNNKSKHKKSFSAPGDHIICNSEYYSGTSIATVYITNFACILKQENSKVNQKHVEEWLISHSKYGNEYSYGFVLF